MNKIFLYGKDDVEPVLRKVKSAVLSLSSSPIRTDVLVKNIQDREGGISQIKRWISTASFRLILIEGLSDAFKDKDVSSFMMWLKDHAEDFEGPYIIIKENESLAGVSNVAMKIDNIDELLLNIR